MLSNTLNNQCCILASPLYNLNHTDLNDPDMPIIWTQSQIPKSMKSTVYSFHVCKSLLSQHKPNASGYSRVYIYLSKHLYSNPHPISGAISYIYIDIYWYKYPWFHTALSYRTQIIADLHQIFSRNIYWTWLAISLETSVWVVEDRLSVC